MTYIRPQCGWTPENVAAIESEIILLKVELASLHDDARCGHEQRFLQWENHGKPIICTLCEIESLAARLAEAEARLRKYEPEPDKCGHGVAEGDWCEPCNKAYKEAADEAAKGGRDE